MRQARRELGWSQAELAETLQVHRGTLIRWESNLSAPAPEQEEQLARAMGRTREWFQGEEPTPSHLAVHNEDALSLEEKVDVLLRRVSRVEKRLEQIVALLEGSARAQ
ncbi:MAG: helix-turn-helix transcriptional regulator [Candidatus Eremiobacteraeota bacterium]|nr:helix-turn-helix transcriptional regulator [Candidatus Eremiobacteraeota bacterium]